MQEIELPSSVKFHYSDSEAVEERKMTLQVPGSLQDYNVDYNGYKKAMRLAGFPEAVINRYPIPLMLEPLNWGFQHRAGDKVKAFVQNDHLVAFVKPNLELVSTQKLLDTIFKVVGEDALVERLDHNLQYTNCSILVPTKSREWTDERLQAKLAPGTHERLNDVVCGGITFQNSIMGESTMEVTGYVYRLICSNGMISAESKFKWSRKTETVELSTWFEEHVRACYESIDHEFDKIEQLIQTPIVEGHRAQVLTNVFQEYELSDKMRHAVLARMADEPPRHMWDVVNAITNIANDEEYADNPHTIRRIQTIGGDISTKLHVCEACYSVSRQ
jgi:hypothetical protein